MSTITTSATEIAVPAEFLPAFATAANFAIMDEAEVMSASLALDYSDESRGVDDEKIGALTAQLEARSSIMRAIDEQAPVPLTVIGDLIKRAFSHLECDLWDDAAKAPTADKATLKRIADTVDTLKELGYWRAKIRHEHPGVLADDRQAVTA